MLRYLYQIRLKIVTCCYALGRLCRLCIVGDGNETRLWSMVWQPSRSEHRYHISYTCYGYLTYSKYHTYGTYRTHHTHQIIYGIHNIICIYILHTVNSYRYIVVIHSSILCIIMNHVSFVTFHTSYHASYMIYHRS